MNIINYNLISNIHNYGQNYIEGKKSGPEFREEKENLAGKLMQMIAMGANQFTNGQQKVLIEFKVRHSHSIEKSEDRVIQLISTLTDHFLIKQNLKKGQLPQDVQDIIFRFASSESITLLKFFPQKTWIRFFSDEINQILKLESKLASHQYLNLVPRLKIFMLNWQDLMVHHEALTKKLLDLTQQLDENDPGAEEFKEVAVALLKKIDIMQVPNEVVRHPAYHGEALKSAMSAFEKLKIVDKYVLQQFTVDYCKNWLSAGQYLIRCSSTVPTTNEKGIKSFTITISYKNKDDKLHHTRITQETKDGCLICWKGCVEDKDNPYIQGFNSIDEVLNRCLNKYSPCIPPHKKEVQKFVDDYEKLKL